MGSYFSDLVRADNSLNTKDDLHVKATEHDFHELVMAASYFHDHVQLL